MAGTEVAIVGSGIAGLTAGLFSARHGRTTTVFGDLIGGELIGLDRIEDYPGFAEQVAGYQLCPTVADQAARAGATLQSAAITSIARDGSGFILQASDATSRADAVIVATGAGFARLGVPGEERFEGQGISHCAACDGPLFAQQPIGVVGSGDHAIQEALILAEVTDRVVLICPADALSGQTVYRQRLDENSSIKVYTHTIVEEVLGSEQMAGISVTNVATGNTEQIEIGGLFVYDGLVPHTDFLSGLVELDEDGFIQTDLSLGTNVPGMFAAGIVRSNAPGFAVTSAADGATAAVAADRHLRSLACG